MQIFDAHLHIIDPAFPLVKSAGFLPEPFDSLDYQRATESIGVVGGAIVSGSFQALDQSYLRAALLRLGPTFVGVTQLPADVSAEEIRELDAVGVRALRFNVHRGGSETLAQLERFAHRVHDLVGWHVEVYVDGAHLEELEARLAALPRIVIDHLGLTKAGNAPLLRLVERGGYVKASGFARLDFDPIPFIEGLIAVRPDAVLFGTDLPGTRSPRPFDRRDLERLCEAFTMFLFQR